LEGLSADLVAPLEASFGISRGVLRTSRDPRGRLLDYEPADDVLEVAEALADAAQPSEVLTSGEVFRLVRRVYGFEEAARSVPIVTSGSEGPREVRAHPLRGARTRRELAAEARVVAHLVGREREQDKLRAAYLRAVRTRRTVFVAVTGELGVGKTALVAAALRGLDPSPQVLRTEGAFGTMDVPFAATAELVRDACRIEDDASPEACAEQLARVCAELIEDEERRASVVDGLRTLLVPDPERGAGESVLEQSMRIKRAVERLVSALALRGPMVVWADALQWIDAPSMDVVRLMLQRTYEAPVLVVLSGRPEARVGPLLDAVPRVEVGELEADADRRALVRRGFGDAEVPEPVVAAVLERAGGNPFFILELVDALLERDEVTVEATPEGRRVVRRSDAPFALPATVQGVIETRLGELGATERDAARWLAVTGPGFTAADLSALAGADLQAGLEDLAARGLVERRAGDAYAFPNAVIRHVAYSTAHPDDLQRMHRRTAAFLKELGRRASQAQVAHHLELSGDPMGAADAYLEAARAAARAFSDADAYRLYGRALRLLRTDSAQRFWTHATRESLLRSMGQHAARDREIAAMEQAAQARPEPGLTALCELRRARLALDRGEVAEGMERLGRVEVHAAPDRAVELETLCLMARGAVAQGRPEEAVRLCDRALALAGVATEWLPWRGRVLAERARALPRVDRAREAAEAAAEALVLFRRLGSPREEAEALSALAAALVATGQLEAAAQAQRAALAIAGHTGDRAGLRERLGVLAEVYERLDRGDEARALRGHVAICP
jgi:eukaryotic-like serine/threonine-protein kinase